MKKKIQTNLNFCDFNRFSVWIGLVWRFWLDWIEFEHSYSYYKLKSNSFDLSKTHISSLTITYAKIRARLCSNMSLDFKLWFAWNWKKKIVYQESVFAVKKVYLYSFFLGYHFFDKLSKEKQKRQGRKKSLRF